MILGKSIRIYLKDGTVSGIKQAEVVNHTIQALSCPRNKLPDLNNYFAREINKPGVYFLIGENQNNTNIVYIGESENVWERLKNHDIKKDFWSEVISFTSKDDNLTKSHVKYLESRLISITQIADRYIVDNTISPSLSTLPLADRDSMEDFILNVKLLNGTLGHKFLENPVIISTDSIIQIPLTAATESMSIVNTTGNLKLYFKTKEILAQAIQSDEGIIVLENSMVSSNTNPFGYSLLREKLIQDGIIEERDDSKLYFSKNYLFKSPSAAAAVISGYNINGRDKWKDKDGRSLNEIEQLEIV